MAHVRWASGGEADVVSCDDDRVVVRSSIAAAPGSRPEGSLEDGRAFRMKVHRCQRQQEGDAIWFEIGGRLLDAPRTLRDHLALLSHKVSN